jgi:hypothetical protein
MEEGWQEEERCEEREHGTLLVVERCGSIMV